MQLEAIPAVLAGDDLLVSSQTGLRMAPSLPGKGPRMLVLTPTRELALQVQKATHRYCSGQKLLTARRWAPFGKLKDHMDRGSVELGRVELLVLDEADRMLDMGFQEEIDSIIARARACG